MENEITQSVQPSQPAQTPEAVILDKLLAAHEGYFDIERDYRLGDRVFDGYAQFHTAGEKYVLTKRAKLWGVNMHEHIFFLCCDELTPELLDSLLALITTAGLELVQPDPEHMTTYLSLVVISRTVSDDMHTRIKRTRFRKNLRFGLQGWVDLRLAVVDTGSSRITTNPQGKKLRETLERNAL